MTIDKEIGSLVTELLINGWESPYLLSYIVLDFKGLADVIC